MSDSLMAVGIQTRFREKRSKSASLLINLKEFLKMPVEEWLPYAGLMRREDVCDCGGMA